MVIENRSGREAVYKIEIAGNAEAHFAQPAGGHFRLPAGKAVKTAAGDRRPGDGFPAGTLRHSTARIG